MNLDSAFILRRLSELKIANIASVSTEQKIVVMYIFSRPNFKIHFDAEHIYDMPL